jgi:lipopolysaccharide export system permease protein
MQFLWRSIDDLVGKGLTIDVLAELFFYAALTMVPTALPLAVLLASLMTFGNLGEKFELTALKASGISLFKIMRPLIVFMIFVSVGAFFFQNNVLPVAQTKMWTLLFSVRQKSPEVEIPEKSFYDQIPNMNLYIDSKNRETGMLYGMIIYDVTRGLDNSRVILADSGKFNFTEDKTRLFLHMYQGELFENLRDNTMGVSSSSYMPFRREQFTEKSVYFPFDANFNRIDEEGMRSQYIGQNIKQLRHSIDSIGQRVDSIGAVYAADLKETPYFGVSYYVAGSNSHQRIKRQPVKLKTAMDVDSLFMSPSPGFAKTYLSQALQQAKRKRQEYEYRSVSLVDQAKLMRRHDIEMQRKFTLSFACIIFFFIGAPLGAIIKKGGLGTPLVISVILFIIYYIFDNTGYKMSRDGKMEVWEGIWLSSAVLLPLGVFFTYKAVGDSAVFNIDAYRNFFNRLRGKEPERTLEVKEVIMTDVEPQRALDLLSEMLAETRAMSATIDKMKPWQKLGLGKQLLPLDDKLNIIVDYLSNSRDIYVINLLNKYPFKVGRRNLHSIIDTTRQLHDRLSEQTQTETQTLTYETPLWTRRLSSIASLKHWKTSSKARW